MKLSGDRLAQARTYVREGLRRSDFYRKTRILKGRNHDPRTAVSHVNRLIAMLPYEDVCTSKRG